jgi:hypothetical protein
MRAAAAGKSNIGISKSVGEKFVKADQRQGKPPAKNGKPKR